MVINISLLYPNANQYKTNRDRKPEQNQLGNKRMLFLLKQNL